MSLAKAVILSMSLTAGCAMLLAAAPPLPVPAKAATGDPVRGGKLFLQCAACHTVVADAPDTVGPNLSGVVGSKAGTRPGYAYSPAMAHSGIVWDRTTLDAFIQRPAHLVPGTKMPFAGVADAKARADLVAYLTTLKAKR